MTAKLSKCFRWGSTEIEDRSVEESLGRGGHGNDGGFLVAIRGSRTFVHPTVPEPMNLVGRSLPVAQADWLPSESSRLASGPFAVRPGRNRLDQLRLTEVFEIALDENCSHLQGRDTVVEDLTHFFGELPKARQVSGRNGMRRFTVQRRSRARPPPAGVRKRRRTSSAIWRAPKYPAPAETVPRTLEPRLRASSE